MQHQENLKPNFIRYRIGVLNDFRHCRAILDYKEFGIVKEVEAWIVYSEPKKSKYDDSICVFFNFKKVLETKSKNDAWKKIVELLKNYSNFTEAEQEVLKRGIYG